VSAPLDPCEGSWFVGKHTSLALMIAIASLTMGPLADAAPTRIISTEDLRQGPTLAGAGVTYSEARNCAADEFGDSCTLLFKLARAGEKPRVLARRGEDTAYDVSEPVFESASFAFSSPFVAVRSFTGG